MTIIFLLKNCMVLFYFCILATERVVWQVNMCILQKFEPLPNHYLYWGDALVYFWEMDTITVLQMFLGKWKSHTRMAQPSEKFRWKKSMACPCFLHRFFSKAVQPSMKVVVGVYINDFFLAVEYANKMVRQIKEWCFFWSVSLQPTKRSTFPHAVLLRHERVACHCFMSFGLCDKNGTASCGYKSQPLSARQEKSLAV